MEGCRRGGLVFGCFYRRLLVRNDQVGAVAIFTHGLPASSVEGPGVRTGVGPGARRSDLLEQG